MSHSQLQSKNGGTCTEWFPSNLLGETSLEALDSRPVVVVSKLIYSMLATARNQNFSEAFQTGCPQKPRGQEELTTSAQVTPAHGPPARG